MIHVPAETLAEIKKGAALAISVSGGKDSQAMLYDVVRFMEAEGLDNEMFVIHADLGDAEWPETPGFVEGLAREVGLPLVVVEREGGLLARMEDRLKKLEGQDKPFWPSSAARYCTSDTKRGPINKFLRRYTHIISVEGIRAEESSARAKKPCWTPRKAINNTRRDAFTWNPILYYSEADVWEACGTSQAEIERRRLLYADGHHEEALNGALVHPAYIYGNERLSCALCVLGSRNDLANGVRHNPELAQRYADLEARSGFTFRPDLSLTELILQV